MRALTSPGVSHQGRDGQGCWKICLSVVCTVFPVTVRRMMSVCVDSSLSTQSKRIPCDLRGECGVYLFYYYFISFAVLLLDEWTGGGTVSQFDNSMTGPPRSHL